MSRKNNHPDKTHENELEKKKQSSPVQSVLIPASTTITTTRPPQHITPTTTAPNSIAIINRSEYQEVVSFFQSHPEFDHFQHHPNHLCHALKVIALIRPHEKFNTKFGIHIQPLDDPWAWLWRWVCREDRATNIQTIRIIFLATFMVLDQHLETMECFNRMVVEKKDRRRPNRTDLVAQIQNTQMVERLIQSIQHAQKGIENLKTTYADDTHTCARIDMLLDSISDKLQLVKISLDYLNGNYNWKPQSSSVLTLSSSSTS